MIGYYYCSLNTFLNIIKNRQIYLSDPLKMNDEKEIRWYLEKLNENQKNDGEYSIFEQMRFRSSINFEYEELVETINRGQKSIYISCFSKSNDILSQWRAYADDGKGVAIGFNLEKLSEWDNLLIREVKYSNSVLQDDMESDVEVIADQIDFVCKNYKTNNREQQIELFVHELIPELAKYKNPAFAEEQEVRLIYCDDLKFEKIVDKSGGFSKYKSLNLDHEFRVIDDNIITEFVKLEFDSSCIEEVCIGPRCRLTEYDIINIFSVLLNVRPKIYKSKSSYR